MIIIKSWTRKIILFIIHFNNYFIYSINFLLNSVLLILKLLKKKHNFFVFYIMVQIFYVINNFQDQFIFFYLLIDFF